MTMPTETPDMGADTTSPTPSPEIPDVPGLDSPTPDAGAEDNSLDMDASSEMPDEPTDNESTPDSDAEMPEEPAEDDPNNNGDTSEIDDLWGKLNTEHRSALLKYGESMADEEEDEDDSEDSNEDIPTENPDTESPEPMMESIVFSKKQLRLLNENRKNRK